MAKVYIQEFERGVLYAEGRPAEILPPGQHRYNEKKSTFSVIDVRPTLLRVVGQEVLSADGVAIKCGAIVTYRITDPKAWLSAVSYGSGAEELMHLDTQLALRDKISAVEAADLLTTRNEWAKNFAPITAEAQARYGVVVEDASVRDISFPGELRTRYAQVALAKQEALASVERARGEQATLRSLANAAKLIESNPELKALRTLIALEKGGGQVVIKGE
ncbi:slipin family protein [Timonella senegalensis]|uniref:slipin family protein n=1 Tax=Timonella senegalensis TaxID=1465825 RepID=UPI0028ABFFFE|nr:slipin family protein [Timonella senegalensis]